MKNYSDDSSSEHDDFDYNAEEGEKFVDNIIESKNIKISTKDAKEIVLDNPFEYPIKDDLGIKRLAKVNKV